MSGIAEGREGGREGAPPAHLQRCIINYTTHTPRFLVAHATKKRCVLAYRSAPKRAVGNGLLGMNKIPQTHPKAAYHGQGPIDQPAAYGLNLHVEPVAAHR